MIYSRHKSSIGIEIKTTIKARCWRRIEVRQRKQIYEEWNIGVKQTGKFLGYPSPHEFEFANVTFSIILCHSCPFFHHIRHWIDDKLSFHQEKSHQRHLSVSYMSHLRIPLLNKVYVVIRVRTVSSNQSVYFQRLPRMCKQFSLFLSLRCQTLSIWRQCENVGAKWEV